MMRRLDTRLAVALALGAALSTTLGCERDASGLTEWTAADHDNQGVPRMRRTQANLAQKTNPHAAPGQKNQVIDVTWVKQCATCHGRHGKGDGPSSTMVKARDLTNAEFQATLTDEQIAKVIREGKDKMPAFNLPDSIIQGLVEHIRGMVKKRSKDPAEDPDGEDEAPEPEAPAAGQNAPASTGSAAAPSPSASPAAGADKTPQAPTQTPPSAASPTAAPSAPAPSAPHP